MLTVDSDVYALFKLSLLILSVKYNLKRSKLRDRYTVTRKFPSRFSLDSITWYIQSNALERSEIQHHATNPIKRIHVQQYSTCIGHIHIVLSKWEE